MRNKLIGEEIYAPFPRFLPGILLDESIFRISKDALDGNIDGRKTDSSPFRRSFTRFGCKNVKIDPCFLEGDPFLGIKRIALDLR